MEMAGFHLSNFFFLNLVEPASERILYFILLELSIPSPILLFLRAGRGFIHFSSCIISLLLLSLRLPQPPTPTELLWPLRDQLELPAVVSLVSLFDCSSVYQYHFCIILIFAILSVNTTLPRDCINISPCQQDTTLLRDQEMNNNVVNACGRTELNGNVDVGQETEIELAAKRVTTVTKGSTLAVTIHQVSSSSKTIYI
jgi:hypothetical protein